jgi:hypothetical protein
VDGDANTVETISITQDDYLWIGYSEPFRSINFGGLTAGTPNANACTLWVSYMNGVSAYSVPDNIIDGTANPAGTPFAKDGAITFDMPAESEWRPMTVNGTEAYWIRIRGQSADLTASVTFARIYLTLDYENSTAPEYIDLANAYDGDTTSEEWMEIQTDDFLYIGHGTKFNKVTVTVGGTPNDIASVMTAQYFNGSAWTAVSITDSTDSSGDTLKTSGDIIFTIPNDWEATTVNSTETYWIRLDFSVNLSTAFSITEITVTRSNNQVLNIPALVANEWTTVMISISETTVPDSSSIKSIGLNVGTDKGACVFSIKGLWFSRTNVDSSSDTAFKMPGGKRINGLEAYAGNVDDPVTNPWIFTTDAVYEMQTQNSDQIVRVPLNELGSLSSPENGLGHCVNGTYLYFNLGQKIERYFNRTLDDVGPDRDEGLPSARQGIPSSLSSYPGRVYGGIDAGISGISSVLALEGTAWHEVYRAINVDERIRNIRVQSIPGTNVDRLWFSTNNDVGYVPISLNPYNDSDFNFHFEGSLITSWMYANLQDVVKLWKSLKVFAENLSANNRYIIADYQVDTDTTWTEIGTYDTEPVEEIDIASTLPQAKRIRFRFRFITNDASNSPRLKAYVVEGVAFVPVKYQYSWTFKLTQDVDNIDLFGKFDDTLTSLQQYDQLVSWANTGQPLTLRHESSLYDNKTVFLNPTSVSPLRIVNEGPEESQEVHVASITCIEA